MRDRFACQWLTSELSPMPRFGRRRSRNRLIMPVGATGILALGAPEVTHPIPRLVYNASASAPLGFYSVTRHGAISRGDLVLARLPDAARRLAADPRLSAARCAGRKARSGILGDIVCVDSGIVLIDNRVAARTLLMDREGRSLPAWHGWRPLTEGEIFLLNESAVASFEAGISGPSAVLW
jgi:type IV secretory pathway protease TraF